jgi:hypothetical protein
MSSNKCFKCGFINQEKAGICQSCGAVLFIDTYGFADLYATIAEFKEPIERFYKLKLPDEQQDAASLVGLDLLRVGMFVASVDGDLSDKEAAILWEIYYNVSHSVDPNLPTEKVRDIFVG